jgi:hypothetical protein
MNSIKKSILTVLFLSTVFISCSDDDGPKQPVVEYDHVAYIVNYGGYGKGNGEISIYDTEKKTIAQNSYKAANNVDFTSNIQSMAIHDDVAYLMSNAGDKIDILDAATLKALGNPVSNDILKPRYFTASGRFAYISCWGKVDDWNVMANSYIAKMNLESQTISKIPVPGGAEGVIVANNKLYIGSTVTKIITVINLSDNSLSFIAVSGVPQQFVEDGDGNIWVSIVSKFSTPVPSDMIGLEMINPKTNKVTASVNFPGIGSNGFISISSDKKNIYAIGGESWGGPTSIFAVGVAAKTIGSDVLITGENFNGLSVNPENNDIYVLVSPDTSNPGKLKIYSSNGVLLSETETGLAPQQVVFYAIEK